MALNFPVNPTNEQEYTIGSKTYIWNSTIGAWDMKSALLLSNGEALADLFIGTSVRISSDNSAMANDDGSDNNNVGIGRFAGGNITTGSRNIAIGYNAAGYTAATTSVDSISIGAYAGYYKPGNGSVLIGNSAGKYATADGAIVIGNLARSGASGVGTKCVIIGDHANTDGRGSYCTFIGAESGRYSDAATTLNITGAYQIALGYKAYASTDNEMSLGNSAHITSAYTAVAFATRSDERQKDFYDMDLGLEFVTSVVPRKYKWKANAEASDKDSYFYGFSAQDVRANLPTDDKYGMHRVQGNGIDGIQNLTYTEMIAPLYKAIQEQQEMIKEMQIEINKLRGKEDG